MGAKIDVKGKQKAKARREEDLHQDHQRSAVLCEEERSSLYGVFEASERGRREEGARED